MVDPDGGEVVEYPVRSRILGLGQVALASIAVLVAAGLVLVPSGGAARAAGIIAAVAVVAGAVYVIRSLRRQAVVVDGRRIGWRRGLTSQARGWTAFADVEGVTIAKMSTSISTTRADVILWTRTGGMRGLDAVLLRPQLSADARARLDADAGTDATLHPFLVPFTALRGPDRDALEATLRARGLLPR